jgi:putative FmdB family regulatory protein
MPTYDYVCSKCGHHFEQFQSMLDAPLKKCPKCKKAGLKRLIGGGAGLIFKGSGFYITDYKKTSGSTDGGDSKPASAEKKSESTTSAAAAPESSAKSSESSAKSAEPAKKSPGKKTP